MKGILNDVAEEMPGFNDYLIQRFRPEKLDGMILYLDQHFRNVMRVVPDVEYTGYRILNPVESAWWRMNESQDNRKVKINQATQQVVRFTFRINDVDSHMYVQLPYIDQSQACIIIDDTHYYPLHLLTERKIRSIRDKDKITVKVAQAIFQFYREQKETVKATDGTVFTEYNVQARVHHSKHMRTSPPLILYHLVHFGFNGTLRLYGIEPDRIKITDNSEKYDENYFYFTLPTSKFLKVDRTLIEKAEDRTAHKNVLRLIVSLMRCLKTWTKYNVEDVYDPGNQLYMIILGRFIRSSTPDQHNLIKYARDHWSMYEVFLDPWSQAELAKMGYPCDGMSDLLWYVFHNIDQWLIEDPTNLYGKMLGIMELTISPFVTAVTNMLYEMISPKKNRSVNQNDVRKFVRQISRKNPKWFKDVCRANPQIIHNNWLMSLGLKSRREFSSSDGKSNVAKELLKSHHSWLAAESIITLPSQNPIISGSLNPYVRIDEDGVIQPPEHEEEIKDVFD